MYSNAVKFFLAAASFSPSLAILWIVNLIKDREQIHFYSSLSSFHLAVQGLYIFTRTNYLLITFLIIVICCYLLIEYAKRNLSKYTVDIKSIKPADINYLPILISWLLPFSKMFIADIKDSVLLVASLMMFAVAGFILKQSYFFNVIFRFMGYKNYEVQIRAEVTYLAISKEVIINPKQINRVVQLTDHMLINLTKK